MAHDGRDLASRELVSYFYNHAEGAQDVSVNDRYGIGTHGRHGDIFASEFHTAKSLTHAWEECRGIGQSFAYNCEDTEQTMMTAGELVHMFIDIISHNGNLSLIIGPDPSGRIPDLQLSRLKALGKWIKVNAEAVYGTRLLLPCQEGACVSPAARTAASPMLSASNGPASRSA